MAVTKIKSITKTLTKSLQYIANPSKTNESVYVTSFGCSTEPIKAAEDFRKIAACGTGRNTVVAQHIIQSFKPDEITPEKAMQIGGELAEEYLKGEYQYLLAVHTDRQHIHVHLIFNNVNMIDGKTFETHNNRKKNSWKILREMSDKICREHNLSVVENPEISKGKSHYEWDMSRKDLSWKTKLKYEIDQIIKIAVDFDDFLIKCRQRNIEVVYNPDNKIDLKFRLSGQQRFTRSRTLGWYYETPQIIKRISQYKAVMNYKPSVKIIRTDTEQMQNSAALRKWADIQNMKNASKIINILTENAVENSKDLEKKCLTSWANRGHLVGQLNKLNSEIDLLNEQRKYARMYRKLKPVVTEYNSLSGRKQKKFMDANREDIDRFHFAVRKLKEWYPDSKLPSEEKFQKLIDSKSAELEKLDVEYNEVNKRNKELSYCREQIEIYLKQQNVQGREQNRQKNKNNQLE